jgi:L-alanine-DL-glutamate epimerase-like enolase superfamily enzyme
MQLEVRRETWPLARTFRISRGARTEAVVVVAAISDGGVTGLGECVPYARYGETVDGVMAEIEALRQDLANGLDREELQRRMPAGAARNAVDCALWDLEAKRSGKRAWQIAGLPEPRKIVTVETVSLDEVDAMRDAARKIAHKPVLKMKLAHEDALARIRAVHDGAPQSRIIVDANEGLDLPTLEAIAPELKDLNVALLEQPLPAGEDGPLEGFRCAVPLCADESCHVTGDLPSLAGKYGYVNIKIDKTGGLTEALRLAAGAESEGFGIMVGCMMGTSLGMAPAALVAQAAEFVDLDGPLWMARDREPGLVYEDEFVYPPGGDFWG